jgi:hypothetical protein
MIVPVAPWLPTFPEFDGLKASAVAVALTLLPVLPERAQIREKKVGKLTRCTVTVTSGFTANAAGKLEQLGSELPAAA